MKTDGLDCVNGVMMSQVNSTAWQRGLADNRRLIFTGRVDLVCWDCRHEMNE